jgi:hypothetical protein
LGKQALGTFPLQQPFNFDGGVIAGYLHTFLVKTGP